MIGEKINENLHRRPEQGGGRIGQRPPAIRGALAAGLQPCRFMGDQSTKARYRKVTIWARVQGALGLKVVAEVPVVMPFV